MLKNLTTLSLAGLLMSGCIIVTNGSTSATNTDTDPTATEGTDGTTAGTSEGTGTDSMGTSEGTGTDSMGTTQGTTDATSTEGTTEATSTTSQESTSTSEGTTAGTSEGTTGVGPGCGWAEEPMYYACAPEGEPGVADPGGIDMLNCPDQELGVDEPCLEVPDVGCCDGDGNLWYCINGKLLFEMCM